MQFNDVSGETGIVQDVWFLTNTDSTSFTLKNIARITNKVVHKLGLLAWKSDRSWNFDDSSKTDMPTATTTLVDDQEDYSLATTVFDVKRVEVKDSGGDWYKLRLRRIEDIGISITEYKETKGLPTEYFLEGHSIRLKPAPDTSKVTASAGLRIWTSRDATEFISTDTTKKPGFPTPFHSLVALEVALEYAAINSLQDKVGYLAPKVAEGEAAFINYFANRGGEFKNTIHTRTINYE